MKRIILAAFLFASPAFAAEQLGAWEFKTITDPMSDATRGIAVTALENDVSLVVKCDSNGDNQLYFSFVTKKYLGALSRSKFRMFSYRIDGTPPRQMSAFHDGNSASVISIKPDNDGGKFLKELATASKFTVQFSNFNGELTTAVIDVTGAKQAFVKAATTCKDNSMLAYLSA